MPCEAEEVPVTEDVESAGGTYLNPSILQAVASSNTSDVSSRRVTMIMMTN